MTRKKATKQTPAKASCLALFLCLLTGVAQGQTFQRSDNFLAGQMTLTVVGVDGTTPVDGYTVYYAFGDDTIALPTGGEDEDERVSPSVAAGTPIAIPNDVIMVKATALKAGATTVAETTFTVVHYPEPTPSSNRNLSLTIIRGYTPGTGESLSMRYWFTSGAATDAAWDGNGTYTFAPGTFRDYTDYYFQTIGDAKYPSTVLNVPTIRFNTPTVADFVGGRAATSSSAQRNTTGTIRAEAGTAVYVNHNIFEADEVTLTDPNPYNSDTYDAVITLTDGSYTLNTAALKFKMTVGPADTTVVDHRFPSKPVLVDENYSDKLIFCHLVEGVPHYLAFDAGATRRVTETTHFSYDCLWTIDPLGSYVTHGNYRLGFDEQGHVEATTNGTRKFQVWGQRLVTSDQRLAYNLHGGWEIIARGNESADYDVEICYEAKSRHEDMMQHTVFSRLNIDSVSVLGTNGTALYHPTWLALDQDATYTLKVFPDANIDARTFANHVVYSFTDAGGTRRRFLYYSGNSIDSYTSTPGVPSSPDISHVRASDDTRFTYRWTVEPEGLFEVCTTATHGTFTLRRKIVEGQPVAVEAPTRAVLSCMVDYNDPNANVNGDPVQGTSAVAKTIVLFAEQRIDYSASFNDFITLPHPQGTQTTPFASGHTFLLRGYHSDDLFLSGAGNDARLTGQQQPERLMKVTLNGTTGYAEFESTALTLAGTSTVKLAESSNSQGRYLVNIPAVRFLTVADVSSTNAFLFKLTAYKDQGSSYFTLTPKSVETTDVALIAENNQSDVEGTTLRLAPSKGSHLRYLSDNTSGQFETEEEVFFATRWRLTNPQKMKPVITMTDEGIVTVGDTSGAGGRSVYGVLQVWVRNSAAEAWSVDPDYSYPLGSSTPHAATELEPYTGDATSFTFTTPFTPGMQLKARLIPGAAEDNYHGVSDYFDFTVRKLGMPSIASGPDHTVVMTPDEADGDIEGVQIMYHEYAEDEASSTTTTLYDGLTRYVPTKLKAYARADNYIRSDWWPVDDPEDETDGNGYYQYKPKLVVKQYNYSSGTDAKFYVCTGPLGVESGNYTTIGSSTHMPETTAFTFRYTINGQFVRDAADRDIYTVNATAEMDLHSNRTVYLFTLPFPSGFGLFHIAANVNDNTQYEDADEVFFQSGADSVVFTAIHNDAVHFLHIHHSNDINDAHNTFFDDSLGALPSDYAWYIKSFTNQSTAVINKKTGEYLTLQVKTVTENEETSTTTSIFASPTLISPNIVVNGNTTTFTTSEWKHSKLTTTTTNPTASTLATYYKIWTENTTDNNREYYIVFDKSTSEWKAVAGQDITANQDPQVLFHTQWMLFDGGADFSATNVRVQINQPVGSDHWEDIAIDAVSGSDRSDAHGWVALNKGKASRLRVVFDGTQYEYPQNRVVYISRHELDQGSRNDFTTYIPWQLWGYDLQLKRYLPVQLISTGENTPKRLVCDFTQLRGYTESDAYNVFDEQSKLKWHIISSNGDTLSQAGETGYPTTITNSAGRDYLWTYSWDASTNATRQVLNISRQDVAANNSTPMPELGTILWLEAQQKPLFSASEAHQEQFSTAIHLFAEQAYGLGDPLTNSSTLEDSTNRRYPVFGGHRRWRFLGRSQHDIGGQYHYLSADNNSHAEVDEVRYPYLVGQPYMTTSGEYTQDAIWMVYTENVNANCTNCQGNEQIYSHTIIPAAAQHKKLVHLPGNAAVYEEERVPQDANGLFILDTTSTEYFDYYNSHGDPFLGHEGDFKRFNIRRYMELKPRENSTPETTHYEVLSPFYREHISESNRYASDNIADYLGFDNQEGTDKWDYAFFGSSSNTGEGFQASAERTFWNARWTMELALLTPPSIEMDPDGTVTLVHRLESANMSDYNRTRLEQHLRYYYTINDETDPDVLPDFTGYTGTRDEDWAPEIVNGASQLQPVGSTTVYNPFDVNQVKPVLTAGQKIHVRAVLDGDFSSASFSYEPHISRVHSFQAVKCRTPEFAGIGGTSITYDHAAGDTVIIGIGMGNVHYSTLQGTHRYPDEEHPGSPVDISHLVSDNSTLTFAARAYQHNKLESDLLLRNSQIALVVKTPELPAYANDSATVTVEVEAIDESHEPMADYYKLQYKLTDDGSWTDLAAPANPLQPTSVTRADADHFPNRWTVKQYMKDGSGSPTMVTLHLRAVPETGEPFYSDSDPKVVYLAHPDYGGTALPASGDVIITSASDLYNVMLQVNNSAETTATAAAARTFKIADGVEEIDLSSLPLHSLGSSAVPFTGKFDGNYCVLKGLTQPLFAVCNGAHIYNVVIDASAIVGSDTYTGGIVSHATGATRIYNSGVRSSDNATTVTGNGKTGGIVGYLEGTSRVINCYNFATVTSNNGDAGGIAGGQATATKTDNLACIVFNCMDYGDINAANGKASPIISGDNFTNNHNGDKGINTYNYYRYGIGKNGNTVVYNCARAAEERYLTRFEFYRGIMNSNLKKCGWWTYDSNNEFSEVTADSDTIGKWVIDPKISKYPIVLPKYEGTGAQRKAKLYPSVINPDFANYDADKKIGTLSVTVNSGNKLSHADETLVLPVTDMNPDVYDYNYGKVQLPYFQRVFGKGSYIQEDNNVDYIVTGWEITTVTPNGTVNSFTSTGSDNPYNFADRKSTDKDLYSVSGRIFAQGGYYNVPEGVTAITITAHWGKVVYMGATGHDYTYKDDFTATTRTDFYGTKDANYTYKSPNATTAKTVYNTLETAYAALGSESSVYDQAIVVVSNCNLFWKDGKTPCQGDKAFTLMSIDEDNDCEPDYCCFTHFNTRNAVAPIRFDFIWMPGSGITYKVTKSDRTGVSKYCPDMGIWKPKGWFEITETALQHYGQFEYYSTNSNPVPLILNNGVIDQFCTTNQAESLKTLYMILGGHVWFKVFAPGTHGDKTYKTKHCPVNVMGGEYEKFYLSGYFSPNANVNTDEPVHFYANGGKFGEFASGGQERITGNVTIKADHIVADEFYGGGINAKNWSTAQSPEYQVQGNISVYLANSKIGTYAGTKFSSLMSGKTITTVAENTEFGTYYGAGIGGSGLNRDRTGQSETAHGSLWSSNSASGGAPKGLSGALSDYRFGQMILSSNVKQGVVVDYEMEMIPFSGFIENKAVGRFYRYEASLSKANVNSVFSTLTNCTVNNDFYGGGFVGTVSGTATSTLTDCTIHGNVYAGGNNSDIPYIDAYDLPRKADNTVDVPWYDETESIIHPAPRSQRVGRYYWKYDAIRPYNHGSPELETVVEDGETKYYIYTNESFDNIGVVNQTNLTLNGNTVVHGSVYGGGDKATTGSSTLTAQQQQSTTTSTVNVGGHSTVEGHVFGAGRWGDFYGSTQVTLGTKPADRAEGKRYADYIPWVQGDIYGGGDTADVQGKTQVTLYSGAFGPVYGGGCTGSVLGNSRVDLLGGHVGYGRSYDTTWTDNTKTAISAVTVNYDEITYDAGLPRQYYGVFGGGFGFGTVVKGTATVNIGSDATSGDTKQTDNISINGCVYGGGEAGQVGGGYNAHAFADPLAVIDQDYYFIDLNSTEIKKCSSSAPDDRYKTGQPHDTTCIYATWVEPAIHATNPTTQVTVKAPNVDYTTAVLGGVFGGGRGYYIMVDEKNGEMVGTENTFDNVPIAGAVFGNTRVEIGTDGQDTTRLTIGTIPYFAHDTTGLKYKIMNLTELNSAAVPWVEGLYVYDVVKARYIPLTVDSREANWHEVYAKNAIRKKSLNLSIDMYDPDVVYYQNAGRMSVAGGGEVGPVYSTSAYNATTGILNASTDAGRYGATGGNTTVIIHSGELGDVDEETAELDGCVYGAGILADIDGKSKVVIDGATTRVIGDVYAGGCMGHVFGYGRSSASDTAYTTIQELKAGWVRNAHGGSNLVEHAAGCHSKLVIGTPYPNAVTTDEQRAAYDDRVLVSESAYAGNGFSPSLGISEVVMHSGKVGFVRAGFNINILGTDQYDGNDARWEDVEGNAQQKGTIVPNNQPGLSYEGNVYGGGFGTEARAIATIVHVAGGQVRNGVFGGGEVATVGTLGGTATYVHHSYDRDEDGRYKSIDTVITYVPAAEGSYQTDVLVDGDARVSMVLGGGRGYTEFMPVKSCYPGTVFGNTRVKVAGNAQVDSVYYHGPLGAGNVYGGGLEGVVTGNTTVILTDKAQVKGRLFGGGRGYRGAMLGSRVTDEQRAGLENIADHASVDAGNVMGNTEVTVVDGSTANAVPTVGLGVYGGGEGMIYTIPGKSNTTAIVATVGGNATVDLGGGLIGGGYTKAHVEHRGSYAGGRIAPILGTAFMHVHGSANVAAVFGGNDVTGKVYGAEGAASETHVLIDGDSTVDNGVTTLGAAPLVGCAFGGGNGAYDNFYGNAAFDYLNIGNQRPSQVSTYVDINLHTTTFTTDANTGKVTYTQGYVGQAFGGGNKAPVEYAEVLVRGKGLVDTLFGGGNEYTVSKLATVRVEANTDIAALGTGCNVKMLFGGNNIAPMGILPRLVLTSGVFDRIFGGGNQGKMTGARNAFVLRDGTTQPLLDAAGNELAETFGTYLLVESDKVTVRNGLFGGGNMADVAGGTYVGVKQTTTTVNDGLGGGDKSYGIYRLFGGNDISAYVYRSRIDVIGGVVHNIYGGGNGYYDYTDLGGGKTVRALDADGNVGDIVAAFTTGRPTTGYTQVNIWGGTINSSIYGGGYAGDCENTHIVVNDTVGGVTTHPATISGCIYGGGNGVLRETFRGNPLGNVTVKAVTDLYHITTLGEAYVYGGGYGGDVQDAEVNVMKDWNKDLHALYGGCYGSNVNGTTTVNMYCERPDDETNNVDYLFGGNDYTGNVNHSVLNVYDGRYRRVFGAGNGEYHCVDNATLRYVSCATASQEGNAPQNTGEQAVPDLPVPNSEYPVVNFYGGEVTENVYGGGNLGTCEKPGSHENIDDYAFVQVNVHGGTFMKNIFAGAAGRKGITKPLIQGLKELNMDGGSVNVSVYGGTESVSDGYPDECVSKTNTTLRPSSILNLVGGTVANNVYGGGYLGEVYGSVYINVGKKAVEESRVYHRTYGTDNHNYGAADAPLPYKPAFVTDNAERVGANLKPSPVELQMSIYAGANWGEPDGTYTFDRQGFYGGEGRIRIDGDGYNTSNATDHTGTGSNNLPGMNIHYSLFGAGTSCEGGDVLRDIRILNYGEMSGCQLSRSLWSVQRADNVMLYNTGIKFVGDQDALTAYPSVTYSFMRCDTLRFVDHNMIQIEVPAIKIKHLAFMTAGNNPTDMINPTLTAINDRGALQNNIRTNTGCNDQSDLCTLITPVIGQPYTTILVNDGAYIDVYTTNNQGTPQYGDVMGYGFLRAENTTQAVVTARSKDVNGSVHATDGGFLAPCNDQNTQDPETVGTVTVSEFPYGNYSTDSYRAWKFGTGRRKRTISIVAHTDTTQLDNNRGILVKTGDSAGDTARLAVAMVPLVLPPAEVGSYYTITGGITVDQENRELELIDGAYLPRVPSTEANPTGNMHSIFNSRTASPVILGQWRTSNAHADDATVSQTDATAFYDALHADPTHKFGLLITDGASLSGGCADGLTAHNLTCGNTAALSSNGYFTGVQGYSTQTAVGNNNVTPTLDVYLTYDPSFTNTVMGSVTFTLHEWKPVYGEDQNGNTIITGYDEAGTIDVVIAISTILKDFEDQKYEMVAMKNGFGSNEYVRRHILPASMQIRTLYLEAVEWEPATNESLPQGEKISDNVTNVGVLDNNTHFFMTKAGSAISDDEHFSLEIVPDEHLSTEVSTTLGWHVKNEEPIDLYKIVFGDNSGSQSATTCNRQGCTDKLYDLTASSADGLGRFIGELDGRSSAALNMTLHYNGSKLYDPEGYRGVIKLHFGYYDQSANGSLNSNNLSSHKTFEIELQVRARKAGDTIYVASPNTDSIERDGVTVYEWKKAPASVDPQHRGQDGWNNTEKKGKEPNQYLRTFKEALARDVYVPGDVICILDSMVIKGTDNFTINGSPYNFIPIVRYTGSNYQMPGANRAYRGPMVVLRDRGQLTTSYVVFDGNMVSSYKTVEANNYTNDQISTRAATAGDHIRFTFNGHDSIAWEKEGWTNQTFAATAPVFDVTDDGIMTLSTQTTVKNCWNNATATNYDATTGILSSGLGAVALTHTPRDGYTIDGIHYGTVSGTVYSKLNPKFVLSHTVTIENNLVGPGTANPANLLSGSVHVERGTMELGVVGENTTMSVWNNYCLPADYATNEDHQFWKTNSTTGKYEVDATKLTGDNYDRANVYLAREGTSDVADVNSRMITFSDDLTKGKNSKIGISKLFPGGPDQRDTIVVAQVMEGRQVFMENAYKKGVFQNDGRLTSSATAKTWYESTISPVNLYFQRCATFRKQLYEVVEDGEDHVRNVLYTNGDDITIHHRPVMEYRKNELSGCPDGTDEVIYSVHGGFYPYTFTWKNDGTGNVLREATSPYLAKEVMDDPTYRLHQISNSDTFVLSDMRLANNAMQQTFNYTATATDLAGCPLEHHLTVHVDRTHGNNNVVLTNPIDDMTNPDENMANAWNAQDATSEATRYYKGVTLTAHVDGNREGIVKGWYNGKTYETGMVGLGPDAGNSDITTTTLLCPGDIISINALANSGNSFIQWDFDPYDNPNTIFVMPNVDMNITAYFGPNNYWKNTVVSVPSTNSYRTEYHGSVHIYDETGLAWLISIANGLNDQQLHTFYYDTVFIHNKTGESTSEYDMSTHLWTPIGTELNAFMGSLEVDPGVTIKGIILNEPHMSHVGFFGKTDGAKISGLHLTNSVFHGDQYVGGITAESVGDVITDCSVTTSSGEQDSVTGTPLTTNTDAVSIITTSYCSGGLAGTAESTTFDKCEARAKYMGAAVYNGGIVGVANSCTVKNSSVRSMPRMSSLYSGGLWAYGTGNHDTKSGYTSRAINNYVHYTYGSGSVTRAGGLVGYTANTSLENNYVYGTQSGASITGALGAMLAGGVHVDNCFYEQGFDNHAFGYHSTVDTSTVTAFSGSGNEVVMAQSLGQNSNLTRQLNRWVYAQGDSTLSYWSADTVESNNGYPVFGTPTLMPVAETRDVATCDSFRVDGMIVEQSGVYYYHVVDSAEFVDSLITLNLTINYGTITELNDSIRAGQDYDGYGFHLTAAEIELLRQTLQEEGTATVVVSDTLQTVMGCDSIVTLYLTVGNPLSTPNSQLMTLKVYPNPTTKSVTVEADGLQQVELYDAVSRKLSTLTANRSTAVKVDLESYPAGPYYLRIRTENGTVIKKVIKR